MELNQEYVTLSKAERLNLLLTEVEISPEEKNNQKSEPSHEVIIIQDQNDAPDGINNNGKLQQV